MATGQNPPIDEMIAGALQWWRDAGVDCAFVDDPVDWLARQIPPEATKAAPPASPPHRTATPEPAQPPAVHLDPASLPTSLDAFPAWWLTDPDLVAGPLGARIAPRGPAQAELMVIVPEPEREDTQTLLSGPQGRLLEAMIAAFGLEASQVYFASVLPRHLPGADWEAIAASGIGLALERHVALATPKRIAVFGASVLPLLAHEPPQGPADLRKFNHVGGNVPMLACRSLAALLEQPRWKARVWQAWLELTG